MGGGGSPCWMSILRNSNYFTWDINYFQRLRLNISSPNSENNFKTVHLPIIIIIIMFICLLLHAILLTTSLECPPNACFVACSGEGQLDEEWLEETEWTVPRARGGLSTVTRMYDIDFLHLLPPLPKGEFLWGVV